MKWLVFRLQGWYIVFTIAIFLSLAMLSGLIQPLNDDLFFSTGEKPIFNGNPSEPKVTLACNVFWGEEYLPEMLEVLDRNNIKITFFIGGSWAKRYPEILKVVAQKGHEIANHTYSHPHPNSLSKEQNTQQILEAERLINDITGIKTTLYAPPYGEYNNTVLAAAAAVGYKTIMWSIDTIDWKKPSPAVIINRVTKKLHNGAIILIHPTESTLEALPELIKAINENGYTITKVSDIL